MLKEPVEGNQMRSCVQNKRREAELLRQNTYFFRIECIKRVQCAKYFTFRLFTCFVSNMVQYSRVGVQVSLRPRTFFLFKQLDILFSNVTSVS